MAVDGFIDYVTQRALEIAEDPDLNFEKGSFEIRSTADFDRASLRRAQDRLGRRLFNDPSDETVRRAHKVLRLALEKYSPESRRR